MREREIKMCATEMICMRLKFLTIKDVRFLMKRTLKFEVSSSMFVLVCLSMLLIARIIYPEKNAVLNRVFQSMVRDSLGKEIRFLDSWGVAGNFSSKYYCFDIVAN